MKKYYRYAYNALEKMGVPVFNEYSNGEPIEGGRFKISAEYARSFEFLDYELAGRTIEGFDDFGVSDKVNEVLSKYGLYGEWENGGCLAVFD